jgi:hypothetical protein
MQDPSKEFSYEEVKKILCKYCETGANCIRKEGGWFHPAVGGAPVLCDANDWRNRTCATIREREEGVNRYPQKCRVVFRKPMVELNNMIEAEMHNWYGTFHEKTIVEGEGVVDFVLIICKENNGEPINHKYRLNDIRSIEVTHEG